jgi:hypothetical protein
MRVRPGVRLTETRAQPDRPPAAATTIFGLSRYARMRETDGVPRWHTGGTG